MKCILERFVLFAISSFFSWLETEDYIVKSPARRIRKIRTDKIVKQVYSDEIVEFIRQGTKNKRDLAIIDLLFLSIK